MLYAYGHHKVADFNKWKPVFDSDEARRLKFGIHVHKLMRGHENPNEVHMMFAVDSLDGFQKCLEDPTLGELMQQSGVLERPDFILLDEAK